MLPETTRTFRVRMDIETRFPMTENDLSMILDSLCDFHDIADILITIDPILTEDEEEG